MKFNVLKKLSKRHVKKMPDAKVKIGDKMVMRPVKPEVTFKVYKKGDEIELGKEEGEQLIEQGFVKAAK